MHSPSFWPIFQDVFAKSRFIELFNGLLIAPGATGMIFALFVDLVFLRTRERRENY
jgi:hypothetical protein